jgi:DNA-binding SARP family transcriptional activator
VLGPLIFERDGREAAVSSGRQRSLLALLLSAGGMPMTRDQLVDELWGERLPASAVSALHVHLSKLRALLGELIIFDGRGYALRRSDFELDVWHFEALVERARETPSQARSLLGEALSLF